MMKENIREKGPKKLKSLLFTGTIQIIAAITLAALLIIIGYILVKGLPGITWEFLSEDPSLNIKNIHGSGFQLIISGE